MSAPSLIPDGTDIAKVGGGGLLATALTVLAGRLFGGQDKVLVRLDALQVSVTALSQQLAVLGEGTHRRDTDVARLEATVAEQGKAIARLEALVEQLSEGVVR